MAFFFQQTEPTPVVAGDAWLVPSTGTWQMRNSANDGWATILLSDANSISGTQVQFVPLGGIAMNSAETLMGSHGLAKKANPAFTTAIKVAGQNVVTESMVQSSIDDQISILDFLSTVFSAPKADQKIAIGYGLTAETAASAFTTTIPRPSFKNADGTTTTQATKSQCFCYVAPGYWQILMTPPNDYIGGNPMGTWNILDQSTSTEFVFRAHHQDSRGQERGQKLWYFIIAVRD